MTVNIEVEAMKYIRNAHEKGGKLHGVFYISDMQNAFIAGATWQQEQDAKRGPRSVSGSSDWPRVPLSMADKFMHESMEEAKSQVLPDQAGGIRVEWIEGKPCFIGFGDAHAINTLIASIRDQKMDVAKAALNSDYVNNGGVMRLLSSIENRLIELAGGPGIGRLAGWLERIDKDLYHVTTRQEKIDIEQRRALDNWGQHLHDMIEPKDNENGCPDGELSPIEQAFELFNQFGLDPHQIFSNYGRNEYAAYLIRRSEKKFGGDFSEAVGEAYADEPPVVKSGRDERDAMIEELKGERDSWHHAYDKLVSDILHGRAFSITIKPD